MHILKFSVKKRIPLAIAIKELLLSDCCCPKSLTSDQYVLPGLCPAL